MSYTPCSGAINKNVFEVLEKLKFVKLKNNYAFSRTRIQRRTPVTIVFNAPALRKITTISTL